MARARSRRFTIPKCEACNGTGKDAKGRDCRVCGGTGVGTDWH
jgi:DnaJ-class molecular chaperone